MVCVCERHVLIGIHEHAVVVCLSGHVSQAAWGGSVLFSKQHRHLMKGVDRYNCVFIWLLDKDECGLVQGVCVFLSLRDQGRFRGLESPQDALCWPAVLRLVVKRHIGSSSV